MRLGIAEPPERDPETVEFEEPASGFGAVASMIGTRNLLIMIVTMPFVFLVVVLAAVSIFGPPKGAQTAQAPIERQAIASAEISARPSAAPVDGQRAVLPIPASADDFSGVIPIPEGASAGAISLDGDRLAVRVDSEEGPVIIIYDLSAGEVINTVALSGTREE